MTTSAISYLSMTDKEPAQPSSQDYASNLVNQLIALGENPDRATKVAKFLVLLQNNLWKIRRRED